MEKKNMLVTIPLRKEFELLINYTIREHSDKISYDVIAQEDLKPEDVKGRNYILGNIPISMIPYADKLEWLQLNTSGYEGYPEALPKDVLLTNTRGAFGVAIAEHMFGMWLSLIKKLNLYQINQQNHVWHDEGKVAGVDDSVVVVVGLGDIGTEFAKRAQAFGAYTVGIKKNIGEMPDCVSELYTLDELDRLLEIADCVALCLPNDKETYKLMDARRLSIMKQDAVLLNVGRGTVVDTQALTEAVLSGRIMAGIDVMDPEPLPENSPLWDSNRAIITPHISGFFHLDGTHIKIVDIACRNLKTMIDETVPFDEKQFINVIEH